MELYQREYLISKIRASKFICRTNRNKDMLFVHHPNVDIDYFSSEIYNNTYEQCIDNDVFVDEDILNLLLINRFWTEEQEDQLNNILPKHIEYWKEELYRALFQGKKRETIRKYLAKAKEEQSRLYNIRHQYDHMNCKSCSLYAKNIYIVRHSTFDINNQKIVDWSKYDINDVLNKYINNFMPTDSIRELARTDPWTNIWNVYKEGGKVFENSNLTIEQQALLSWSIMYDRISESPDCPSDDVIEDDDLLDGWLIIQRKKREEEKKKAEAENKLGTNSKTSDAGEIYIIAETKEDIERIDSLNDHQAKMRKKQKFAEIDRHGIIKEQQLSDVKRELMIQANQAYIQQMKRGKR